MAGDTRTLIFPASLRLSTEVPDWKLIPTKTLEALAEHVCHSQRSFGITETLIKVQCVNPARLPAIAGHSLGS